MTHKFPWLNDDRKRRPDSEKWWRIDDDSQIGYRDLQYSIKAESLLHEFRHNGERVGIVTRNRYNAKVLNAPTMLIADVDIGDPQLEDGCFVSDPTIAIVALEKAIANVPIWSGEIFKPCYWLLEHGQLIKSLQEVDLLNYPSVPMIETLEDPTQYGLVIQKFSLDDEKAQFVDGLFYGLGFRVYATAGGLRYICTTHRFSAGMDIEDRLLRYVFSDPRYRRICKEQQTFRARLTPKPWRVKEGCIAPQPYPRTCKFLGTRGSDVILPEFQEMVQYHDLITGCQSSGALA